MGFAAVLSWYHYNVGIHTHEICKKVSWFDVIMFVEKQMEELMILLFQR